MPFDDHTPNFAYSLVATAPSPATTGLSLVVTAAQGALFPTPPFNATIWPASTQPLTTNAEIVRVTAISTDTLTIARAQESTSARTVIVGDQIAATITAKTLTDVEAGFSPDLPLVALAPPRDQTIPAGYAAVVPDYYELVNVVTSNEGTSTSNTPLSDPVLYYAQSFRPSDNYTLVGVDLRLFSTGSPADNFVVQLRSGSSTSPSATVLATSTISAATVAASIDWYRFAFTVAVTYGASYWIVAHRTGATDGANVVSWGGTTGDSYSLGDFASSSDSGVTFTPAASDQLFRVAASRVTEIGTGSILAITA